MIRRTAAAAALLLGLMAVLARAAPDVPLRPMLARWQERTPVLRFSAEDFVNSEVAEKLGSGLPQRIVTRVYAYPARGDEPITAAVLSCRVAYDLWEGVYRVEEQTETRDRARSVPDLKGVVKTCLNVGLLSLGDASQYASYRGRRIYFAALVELNPLSPDTVQRIRRWLSKSGAGQLRGDAFFGSFVSIFVSRRMGSAEHSLAFRSKSHRVP